MKKIAALIFILTISYSGIALAIPMLQLDIEGGAYDTATQTIVATSDTFALYALLDPTKKKAPAGDTFYISAALLPDPNDTIGPGDHDLGSFSIGDTTFDVTEDMVYGTPPIEDFSAWYDPGDLPKHGIFPTWFQEIEFNFTSAETVSAYNSATGAAAGDYDIYRSAFEVDTTNLAEGYTIHFDLYHTVLKNWKYFEDVDVDMFAPFSHDAQSGPSDGPEPVPEPTTILLLSSGLFGVAGYMRRKKSIR